MNQQNPLYPDMTPARQGVEAGEPEVNVRELLDIVLSGKWIVLGITLAGLFLGGLYAVAAKPVYSANGLVQVEQQKPGIGQQMDQLSSMLKGSTSTEAPAETAILKSRLIMGEVARALRLDIQAEPHYFPIIGRAIARRTANRKRTEPAAAPLGLGSFAWGAETLRVTALEVPKDLLDERLSLEALPDQQYEISYMGDTLLTGRVGERVIAETPLGAVSIFVPELVARVGTRFRVTKWSEQEVMDKLNKMVAVVEQPRDSGILNLSVTGDSPEFAAKLVNEIEQTYLRQNVERRSAQAGQSLEFLKKQLPDLKSNVDAAQAELNRYQLKRGTVDVKQETELYLKQSVDLETQRLKLIQERNVASQRFTTQHPVVAGLNEQIAGIEREQGNLKKQIGKLPETQQDVLGLLRDVDVNTELYTTLMNSAQELQVAKAGTIGDVRIIDGGLPPLKPIKPQKMLVTLIGAIAGLIVGIGTVFALRALIRGVDRPEDVERALGLATYASIPYTGSQRIITSRVRRRHAGNLVLASANPDDTAIEALRSLRTSLHFAMMEANNNVVMLTGPTAALGKSFVSINLSAVLAQSGKRVIVIDADMRRGLLYRYFNSEQSPGLSNYVAGGVELSTVTHKTHVENLDFLPSGTRPPNPAEILMSERFADLLKDLSKRYDLVVIDTPPILPVTDAAIVGRLAGTTLLILKSAEHPMRAIEESVKRLRAAGIAVRGTIFNQVGAKVGSYGYGSYGAAYGYSTEGYSTRKGY